MGNNADPDPNFHFESDPDPDPIPSFTHIGKSSASASFHRIIFLVIGVDFLDFGLCIEIFWKKI
jgi:hypothetical protein